MSDTLNIYGEAIREAKSGNREASKKLLQSFVNALQEASKINRDPDPHPALVEYFAFCFMKILAGVDCESALNLKHPKNRPVTRDKRAMEIAVAMARLIPRDDNGKVPYGSVKKAKYEVAELFHVKASTAEEYYNKHYIYAYLQVELD